MIGSARVHEVVAWGLLWPNLLANLAGLSDAGALWVSHLDDRECTQVREALPDIPIRLRLGTRLWLGDRGALRAGGHGAGRPRHPAGPVRRVPPASRAARRVRGGDRRAEPRTASR